MFYGSELYEKGQIIWLLKYRPKSWGKERVNSFYLKSYRSPRRWALAVNTLKEEGELVYGGAVSISQLMKKIADSILPEVSNIEEALRLHRSPTEHARRGTIKRDGQDTEGKSSSP
jgi:hypothetical protein